MGRSHFDTDDPYTGIILITVMDSISQVPQPGPQVGAVVLLDEGSVYDNVGEAADRGPLAGGVQEADVDVRIVGEIVSLAGLGVGVEEEIDATGFLQVS